MEFTCARPVTRTAVVSYTAFPPLPPKEAVYFCCTGLGVTSTGRYPASCPAKPGLSSSEPFRLFSRDYLAWLRKCYSSTFFCTCKKFHSLLFTPFSVTLQKFISNCLRQWNFGLYVSGFWHIHAKTPRGIVACEQ